MGVYKDTERGTWFVELRYKNVYGESKKKKKRGFKKQSDAKKWEVKFLNSLYSDPEITFENLYVKYHEDLKTRCKLNTLIRRESVFKNNILPYFSDIKIKNITPLMIRDWQNKMIEKNFSQSYLSSLHRNLSSFFNFAKKFYHLKENPCYIAGGIGNRKPQKEMKIWSLEDFKNFITFIKKPMPKLAFEILFFTGIRIGELFALTFSDIDFEKKIIKITKSYQKINGKEVITSPKTPNSVRNIDCPNFLINDLKLYIEENLYYFDKNQKIITIGRHGLSRYIKNYYLKAGVEKIRLHDIRHSHASYLLYKNVNIVAISKRLGHENIKTTLNTYSHLLPESQNFLVSILNSIDV